MRGRGCYRDEKTEDWKESLHAEDHKLLQTGVYTQEPGRESNGDIMTGY